VSKIRLFSSASFRLTALYLILFTLSAVAVDGFIYIFILHSQERAFAQRIDEETEALVDLDNKQGRARLAANIEARSATGGSLAYGLFSANGERQAGRMPVMGAPGGRLRLGWTEGLEADDAAEKLEQPDMVRMLTTQLADGSLLVVGDERTAVDAVMHAITSAFVWSLGVALALGVVGGLWLSRYFLKRIEVIRTTAQGVIEGDWRRRIPESILDDDLAALAKTFNRLFERIEKLLLAQKHVGSDIAHDLRRPLTTVLRELERARGGREESLERAVAGIEQVLQTFDALLRIGEVESGARRAAFAAIDLADVATDVVEAFRPSAEEENRTFTLQLEAPLPIRGDSALLKQALANLIDNALRHTKPGVGIEVLASRSPEGICLEVADHGQGVVTHDRANLFRRFFRADAARHSPGTGLGLALVAAIAELHDMQVAAIDNAPGLRVRLIVAAKCRP
jgi:signal transduction histidine kinase